MSIQKILLMIFCVFSIVFAQKKKSQETKKEDTKNTSTKTMVKPMIWQMDKDHSSVNFTAKHLGLSEVQGKFDNFSGTFQFDPKQPEQAKLMFKIQAKSINTFVQKRDEHLRSSDFFDAEKFPEITFESTGVRVKDEPHQYELLGELMMHGVKKQVIIHLHITEEKTHPMNPQMMVVGAKFQTEINRQDYNIGTGNWMSDAIVSNEVQVNIFLELDREKL